MRPAILSDFPSGALLSEDKSQVPVICAPPSCRPLACRGEQQMLAIARALMARPRLLLLDEPTLGLAPKMARFIFELVGTLRSEGLTIVLAEQMVQASLNLADRAFVIENGRMALQGTASALAADPRIREAYLGL